MAEPYFLNGFSGTHQELEAFFLNEEPKYFSFAISSRLSIEQLSIISKHLKPDDNVIVDGRLSNEQIITFTKDLTHKIQFYFAGDWENTKLEFCIKKLPIQSTVVIEAKYMSTEMQAVIAKSVGPKQHVCCNKSLAWYQVSMIASLLNEGVIFSQDDERFPIENLVLAASLLRKNVIMHIRSNRSVEDFERVAAALNGGAALAIQSKLSNDKIRRAILAMKSTNNIMVEDLVSKSQSEVIKEATAVKTNMLSCNDNSMDSKKMKHSDDLSQSSAFIFEESTKDETSSQLTANSFEKLVNICCAEYQKLPTSSSKNPHTFHHSKKRKQKEEGSAKSDKKRMKPSGNNYPT